jgi:hypothetical protein
MDTTQQQTFKLKQNNMTTKRNTVFTNGMGNHRIRKIKESTELWKEHIGRPTKGWSV